MTTGKSQSWGFFFNGGKGAAGTSINFTKDGLSGAKGFGGGGLGVSGGVQFCESYTYCGK